MRSILIVAGEASADHHGAKLIEELRRLDPAATTWGIGGKAMREQGFDAVVPAEELSVAGLTEVLLALPRVLRAFFRTVRMARERRPSVAVLIDMPDFNLRLAKRLRAMGIKVVYYISPQVWAWRQRRVHEIRRVVDEMLCIFPFEPAFYAEHGVPARFVGHPFVSELPEKPDAAAARHRLGLDTAGPVIALLPGSRRKEVTRHLKPMLEAIQLVRARYPNALPVIPVASTIPEALVKQLASHLPFDVRIVREHATDVLAAADAAMVCSGTSTLQAALLSRPMVVVYKVSWLTFHIVKRLVRVAHIAMVNLIAGKAVVRELIQDAFTPQAASDEVLRLLDSPTERQDMLAAFASVRQTLGAHEPAREVARVVLEHA